MHWRRNELIKLLALSIFLAISCSKKQTITKPLETEKFELPQLPFTWTAKELTIRIGLGEYSEIYLMLEDSFYIYDGNSLKFKGTKSPLHITMKNPKPAQYYYFVSYGYFETLSEALEKAREIANYGIKAKVKEIGIGIKTPKSSISNYSYLVYQGPFNRESEALRHSPSLKKGIFKEVKTQPQGTLILKFSDKTYTAENVLRIVSKSPIKVLNFRKKDIYSGHNNNRIFLATGIVEIRPSNSGNLNLINELPMDLYIEGVLKGEMPASFPKEALKAQAVAARTNAIYTLKKKLSIIHEPYDLTADVFTQNFEGFNDDPYLKSVVEETRGEIITYQGKPIQVFYHSSCGGASATSQEIFGKSLPYYIAKDDNFNYNQSLSLYSERDVRNFIGYPSNHNCNYNNKYYRWERTISSSKLSENIRAKFGKNLGLIRNLTVTKRGPSGRASVLLIEGDNGSMFIDGDFNIRKALDPNMLPSSLIYIDKLGDQFLIRGAGFGHGVGMCQYGAAGLASKGKNYKDILRHYYPGTKIEKIY